MCGLSSLNVWSLRVLLKPPLINCWVLLSPMQCSSLSFSELPIISTLLKITYSTEVSIMGEPPRFHLIVTSAFPTFNCFHVHLRMNYISMRKGMSTFLFGVGDGLSDLGHQRQRNWWLVTFIAMLCGCYERLQQLRRGGMEGTIANAISKSTGFP